MGSSPPESGGPPAPTGPYSGGFPTTAAPSQNVPIRTAGSPYPARVADETGTASRVDHLDGIRAIAIVGVLCIHWVAQYSPFGHGGRVGVDIFFVLSGFIITTLLWRWRGAGGVGRQYVDFLKRRVRRLYPALAGLCVLTPLVWVMIPDPPVSLGDVVERSGLAMVQATWLPEALGHSMDPFRQTWSLAHEWYFYLLWAPLVLWLRRRVTAARAMRWTAAASVVLILVPAVLLSPEWYYFGPLARFGELLAGAALALLMQDRPDAARERRTPEWLAWASVVVLAGFVVLSPSGGPVAYLGVPIAVGTSLVLVWHGYSGVDGPMLQLLRTPPIALLGRVSYSLYLWHWLPIYALDKDFVSLPTPVLGLLGVTAAAVLTALSYRFLEKPFLSNRSDALAPAATATR